jgi:biopolymer transport protein TolR
MAMTSNSGSRGLSSDINVTPLIDVLLVLLIIFMVIVPMVPKGQGALLPKPHMDDTRSESDRAVVISVLHHAVDQAEYKINQDAISKNELPARLLEIYANRAERVMFVKGDDDVNFSEIAEVIDMGHNAGVDHVALMTPRVLAGN